MYNVDLLMGVSQISTFREKENKKKTKRRYIVVARVQVKESFSNCSSFSSASNIPNQRTDFVSTCFQNILPVWMPNMRGSPPDKKLNPRQEPLKFRLLLSVSHTWASSTASLLNVKLRILFTLEPESSIYFQCQLGPGDRQKELMKNFYGNIVLF